MANMMEKRHVEMAKFREKEIMIWDILISNHGTSHNVNDYIFSEDK
jgi:hypothetical protein